MRERVKTMKGLTPGRIVPTTKTKADEGKGNLWIVSVSVSINIIYTFAYCDGMRT
jgi:hypothetical protein